MRRRDVFLDKLRVAATCAVVMLHTVTGVMDTTDMGAYPVEKRVFLVVLDLVCWCVPLFLLISGYLFLNPARDIGMGRMLTKYCRRIVLALFFFGVPYACLEQIAMEEGFRWGMVAEAVHMVLRGESWSHMWYLYLILLLYLLTPPLKWMLIRVPRWTVYALLLALFVGASVLPYLRKLLSLEEMAVLPDGGIYFFYYISGYLFVTGQGKRQEDERGGMRREALGHLPLFAGLLAAGMVLSRLVGDYTVQMAYNYPFTVLLSLLLFGWAAGGKWPARRMPTVPPSFWEGAAALSFAVYLIHPVFLNIAYKFLHVTLLSFPIGVSLPLFFTGTLLLSTAVAWALRQIPFLRGYVL